MSLLAALPQWLNLKAGEIPKGARNRSGRPLTPTYITIHNTANEEKGADALMHARYLRGEEAQQRLVSWHFTVDDEHCVQHLPLTERGMHAGTALGNAQSIGIEICEHAGIDQPTANRRAATLTAVLLRHLGLDLSRVVPHQHWSGKHCPHLLLDKRGTIQSFLQLVKIEYDALPAGASAGNSHAAASSPKAVKSDIAPVIAKVPAPTDQVFALDAEGTSKDTVGIAKRIR